MKKNYKKSICFDDFLFGKEIAHPLYGEEFAKILVKIILNREPKIIKIVPQMNYYG